MINNPSRRLNPMRRRTLLAILLLSITLSGQNTVYNQRKQQYLSTNGEGLFYKFERVWAWLENIRTGQIDGNTYQAYDVDGVMRPVNQIIHSIIHSWATPWTSQDSYPPYGFAWRWSTWGANLLLFWIYEQYGDVITTEDRDFLNQLYSEYVQSRDFCPFAPNAALDDMAGRYLFLESHRNYEVVFSYAGNTNVKEFEYQGRAYQLGQRYNAYQLARDWILCYMETWVKKGCNELDSPDYTFALIDGFLSLYQFSTDEEMKRRSKIMVDFLLLESIVDFSGSQWGGSLGRTYSNKITQGKSRDYLFAFWDILWPSHEPPMHVFACDYRVPDLIWDIGDLDDETDKYSHMVYEYNASILNTANTGKWNYVTKFYSLGGQCNGSWQLCIRSEDKPSSTKRPGVPFRLWINDKAEGEDLSTPVSYQEYITIGLKGHQYKNALFVFNGIYFHYALDKNSFDTDVTIGNFRFIKEGRTMVAMRIRNEPDKQIFSAGMEVAIEGVDYPSFQDFQTEVLNHCDLDRVKFINSKGDWISWIKADAGYEMPIVKKGGVGDYQTVFKFPFKRLECIDNFNKYIILWQDNVMTVRRHGKQMVYNFNNWTVTESTYVEDYTPPGPVTGVEVVPVK